MIRHHAFFEALGEIEELTPQWKSIVAGLAVMRLVDRVADEGEGAKPSEWAEVTSSRAKVEAVSQGDAARAILLRSIEELESDRSLTERLGSSLLAYGRALDLEARWPLAADVFQTIAERFSVRLHPRTVIEACTALGAAARNAGEWETSDRAYARAEHLAESAGDRALALTVQVGLANSLAIRGNLPAAEGELSKVFSEARSDGLQQIEALALHARASLAHLRGDYQQTIHLGYRSLELTTNPSARERILSDIAAAYAGLGMRETARDGYSIVAMTSPHQWVRWQATLNLMELALDEGDEQVFDNYVKQVENASLDPRLQAYFFFFLARGARKFGRLNEDVLFREAYDYAASHQLNQIAHEIETERKKIPAASLESSELFEPSPEVRRVAEALGHLRESVSS